MNHPLITTFIPTFRRPILLKRAINSVLRQTCNDFQVCVYDNCSGDETEEIVKEIANSDSRVKYFCHSENIGAARNFDYALKHINTRYFSILSDDDLILPDFYSIALSEFTLHPGAMFVSTGVLEVNRFNEIVPEYHVHSLPRGLYIPPKSIFNIINPHPPTWTGILFKKEVLDKIGFLDEEVGMFVDTDFILRAAAQGPFVYNPNPGAIFTPGSISIPLSSARGKIDIFWPGWLKMVDKILSNKQYSFEDRKKLKQIFDSHLRSRLLTIGLAAIILGNYSDAFKASRILCDHCKLKNEAVLLFVVAKLFQLIFVFRWLFVMMNNFRFLLNKLIQIPLIRRYRKYQEFIKV
jgi:glycosyltransferase involved in cell wall biosynthesis